MPVWLGDWLTGQQANQHFGQILPAQLPLTQIGSRQAWIDLDDVIFRTPGVGAKHQVEADITPQFGKCRERSLGEPACAMFQSRWQRQLTAEIAKLTIGAQDLITATQEYPAIFTAKASDAGGSAGNVALPQPLGRLKLRRR
jgi:hypothetical protein